MVTCIYQKTCSKTQSKAKEKNFNRKIVYLYFTHELSINVTNPKSQKYIFIIIKINKVMK